MDGCNTFWGSHGCDKPAGHTDHVHVCGIDDEDGVCSEAVLWPDHTMTGNPNGAVRFRHPDGSWSEWTPWALFAIPDV